MSNELMTAAEAWRRWRLAQRGTDEEAKDRAWHDFVAIVFRSINHAGSR